MIYFMVIMMIMGMVRSASLPNIVVILADDMGFGDLGVFGSPSISTPHLDLMAQEGIKLTKMYTAQPICTPARAALLTGRLPIRTGMFQNVTKTNDNNCTYSPGESSVLWWNSIGGINSNEVTLPSLLQENGYTTALVGKWHIGIGRDFEYLPTRKGFQHFYGIPLWHMGNQGNQSQVPDVPLMNNETVIGRLYADIDVGTLTPRYLNYISQFLNQNKEKPFFLYYAPDNTHEPVYCAPQFVNSSARGPYGDAVVEMDWSVGQILAQLKTLGLDDNTFVIWSNDNGPALYLHVEAANDLPRWSQAGNAGPFFGGKGTTWEGGVRVPAIARWPGKINPNTVSAEPSSLMDIFPTVLEMAGIPVPKGLTLDGKTMSPILFKNGKSEHDFIYHWRGDTLYSVLHGNYKAHFWTQGGEMYQIPGIQQHDPPLLFNIMVDPSEAYPLSKTDDPNYNFELQAILQAAKEHIQSFAPASPEFNICDPAAGIWKPDLPVPPSHITCCVGGGN